MPFWITPEKVLDRLVFPTLSVASPGAAVRDCPAAGQAGQRGAVAAKVQRAVDGHRAGAAAVGQDAAAAQPQRDRN